MNRIENSRKGYENTGATLEREFLGTIKANEYKTLAYATLHEKATTEKLSTEQEFVNMLKLREVAQKEFTDTLSLANKDNYINFKKSMDLVEQCQPGDPENPSHFFSKALYNYIKNRFEDDYTLKFFTAVGGTHLDVVHKIDFYFKLYAKETGEEQTYATVDITGRNSKDKTRANVLLNIDPDEQDKYDPSPVNKSFDKEFFAKKIAEFGEVIIQSLIENYKTKAEQD